MSKRRSYWVKDEPDVATRSCRKSNIKCQPDCGVCVKFNLERQDAENDPESGPGKRTREQPCVTVAVGPLDAPSKAARPDLPDGFLVGSMKVKAKDIDTTIMNEENATL